MVDIELIVKISEESYKNIKKQVDKRDYPDMQIGRAIANGTPLPKGHWIPGGYDDNYYICDKCNYKASEYYFKPRYNYCPNCGAKMVEQED